MPDRRKYIIQDWAGNLCFHGQHFESFEDAWGYIREHCPEDSWEDYSVIEHHDNILDMLDIIGDC